MPNQLKVGVVQQVSDIRFLACEEVVETDDIVALVNEAFAEVGPEEAGTPGNKDSLNQWHWGLILGNGVLGALKILPD